MRVNLKASAMTFALVLAHGGSVMAAPPPVCMLSEPGMLQCAIDQASDCDKINDYPYARDLFCAAAFSAAQAMVSEVEKTLGVKGPTSGFFTYFQALADTPLPPEPPVQTTVSCMNTAPPYPAGKDSVTGAGTPLCNLVAYVTSPGSDAKKDGKDSPIPKDLRDFPEFFSSLYSPDKKDSLTKFRPKSPFDNMVIGLGAGAADQFAKDYKFSETKLYAPDHFAKDPQYMGISGGGGGGWGGEIAIVGASGPVVQLAFGGGGGGGMTSRQKGGPLDTPTSGLGAGGGGGVQFGNGYHFGGTSYNGLGLGAGSGNTEAVVQYSYNDYVGSSRTPLPNVHIYNAPIIADYEAQLKNLGDQLKTSYRTGKAVVVRGGGGMGAGTQFVQGDGKTLAAPALSTQGGFQFNYQFLLLQGPPGPGAAVLTALNDAQENIYAIIGESYLEATKKAFQDCGSDYSQFACMCPKEHANVICAVTDAVGGDATKVPGWLNQRHCPGDPDVFAQNSPLSSYQQLLAENPGTGACSTKLANFFNVQNTPNNNPY